MRPSFVRLVVGRVLLFWAVSIAAIVVYGTTREWTAERAQADGVFLIHELMNETPPEQRAARLARLRPHCAAPLALVDGAEVTGRTGLPATPGTRIPLRVNTREAWWFLVLADGSGAVAAGPVNPTVPAGFMPIGVLVGVLIIPILASLLALRIERAVSKVERATEALGVGALDTRVTDADGPSKELGETFNAMADRIERLVRSRDELVQAVSHELGSPLSRLRFQLQLLSDQISADPEGRLDAMTRDLDALDELVAELLRYVQSDHTEPQRQTFAPQQTLRDLAELTVLDLPDGRELQVTVELAAEVQVHADPRLFQRAIENLLRNAAVHAQGTVQLTLAATDGEVQVAVHDDGPGIPQALREKVMRPFVRLDPDRSRHTGGVGLGLAIVHRIMQAHRGRLLIDRSPLGGAAVSTRWPSLTPGETS